MKRVLSGLRPTGRPHIGNLLDALNNWRNLQDKYDCFFFVADWHFLTTAVEDIKNLPETIVDMVVDWMAVGIDPEKCTIFVQSNIKQHAELHLLFSMLISVSRLLRNPTFKEHVAELKLKELRKEKKKTVERIADATIERFLELVGEGFEKEKLKEKEYREILKVRLKESLLEGAFSIMGAEEEEISYGHLVSYGYLGYPVLQAADILIYKADYVPVGGDQLPHLELAREIAKRFNSIFSPVFPLPEPLLTSFPRVPGTDNRKMSKSYGNAILVTEDPNVLLEKVMGMYTDPEKIRKNDPGHPQRCPVFAYHQMFNKSKEMEIKEECTLGKRGCVQCKKEVAKAMIEYLAPYREKRNQILSEKKKITEVLKEGNKRAKEIAERTMEEVREAMSMWRD